MNDKTFIYPSSQIHYELQSFQYADDDYYIDPQDAQRQIEWIKQGDLYKFCLIDYNNLKHVSHYSVSIFLTTIGQLCEKTLQRGMVWNVETCDVDVEETKAWYRSIMSSGEMKKDLFDKSRLLDYRFNDIKDEIVLFRLQADYYKSHDIFYIDS